MKILSGDMRERIDAILDSIRPAVHAHGGEIEIAEIDEAAGKVRLKFRGACGACALAPITLKLGVEPLLKKEFPWIVSVSAE
jgi:Fe-S cluster biogenesis protein NfuA